jgi:y4mF family transcriptional regulator
MTKSTPLSITVKQKRKELELTQEDLAMRSGVGLRFVRDLEQGKESLRLDKVNQVLNYFGLQVGATPMSKDYE